jgi:hypothetical protein
VALDALELASNARREISLSHGAQRLYGGGRPSH